MTARLLVWTLVVATVMGACGEPAPPVPSGGSDKEISLEVSPAIARAGDEIEIRISSPNGATYGLETVLERQDSNGWRSVSWLIARPNGRIAEFVASKRGRVPQVGFRGSGVVKAIVPKIAPGDYRLSKEFFRGEGISSVAHAHFEVEP